MSVFNRRRFPVEIILVCVRWYCKYGITYRDLAEIMQGAELRSTPRQSSGGCSATRLSWRSAFAGIKATARAPGGWTRHT